MFIISIIFSENLLQIILILIIPVFVCFIEEGYFFDNMEIQSETEESVSDQDEKAEFISPDDLKSWAVGHSDTMLPLPH